MENISETSHALTLENREHLSLSGISDVDSFNEEEIVAICSCGELTIKGELLHIEELNLENGSNYKKQILEKHKENELWLKVLHYAYNPNFKYYQKKILDLYL